MTEARATLLAALPEPWEALDPATGEYTPDPEPPVGEPQTATDPQEAPDEMMAVPEQLAAIKSAIAERGWSEAEMKAIMAEHFPGATSKTLTLKQGNALLDLLETRPARG